ncbi:MAG: HEAT repeat domain-containing protein [Gammaproteobacteria bacterium]|nr:HEAT repeat domain-containing protein [Gammaproteobacteria bacterium]
MDRIKVIALALISIVVCLFWLLAADSYRQEAPVNTVDAGQTAAPISRLQPESRAGREQTAALEWGPVLAPAQAKPDSSATLPIDTQPVDWPLILYPELAWFETLESQPADRVLAELLSKLSSDDPVIRLAAIESLGDMTIPGLSALLSPALRDPDPQVRIAVLEALAAQADESVLGNIEPHLYDQDRDVRLAAIEAMVELANETSVYALAGLLSDQDLLVRRSTVNALGEIGGENARMYLLQARHDPNASVRANAEAILAELE